MNKFICGGNLTRDVEVRAFANGGKVAVFGVAVNNRRKNNESGEWENEPVFLDWEAWNKTADLIAEHFKKGDTIYLEGIAKLDQWSDKDGNKRSKVKFVVREVHFPLGGKKKAPKEKNEATSEAVVTPSDNDQDIPF